MSQTPPLTIEVVSDIVCPWCFIGKRRLEQAIQLVREDYPDFNPELRWQPFFLNPDTPPQGEPYRPFLIQKFGGREQMEAIFQRVRDVGAPLGIDYRFEKIEVRANTLDAHRLIHRAQQQGNATALVERLFAGQFERGENVSDRHVLADIAAECGDDRAAVLAYLDSDQDVALIKAMERESRGWGVTAVPTFIFARKVGIQGAEAPAALADAIKEALNSGD